MQPKTNEPVYNPHKMIERKEGAAGHDPVGAYPRVSREKLGDVLGVHKSTVSQIFRGRHKPKFEMALKIADLMEVKPQELLAELEKWQKKFKAKEKRAAEKRAMEAGKVRKVGVERLKRRQELRDR